jgi:branched-chain amino acid transport system substrate-binding protein
MTTRRAFIQAGTAFAACFAIGVGRSHAADAPGVSASEIKFGQTMPYSGPLSVLGVIGRAEAAYFQMINDMGGVNGRKLDFVSLDDAYSPPKTVEQTRRLIEEEQVAFIFGSFGGATTLATRQYLNDNKTPQIFVSSAADLVADPTHFPWTLGLNPAVSTEARVYAKHILANRPDAKIGVLYQNDTLGRGFVAGIRGGAGASTVVKDVSYEISDPLVDSQVVTLQAAGVDALIIAATSRAAAQAIRKAADLGWTPDRYLFSGASSVVGTLKPAGLDKSMGVISATYAKDPSDPRWAVDPGYKAWADFAAKRLSPKELGDNAAVYGFNAAAVMVQVLRQCGDDLSRQNIMRQALNLKAFTPPMGLPGTTIETAPDNYLPIQQLQLAKFSGERWELLGDIIKG